MILRLLMLLLKVSISLLTDVACFHSQQCAEKYLKAYLQEQEQRFPRVHAFGPLLDLCITLDKEFLSIRQELDSLEGYDVAIRYPGIRVTLEMAQSAISAATRVRTFVRDKLNLPK